MEEHSADNRKARWFEPNRVHFIWENYMGKKTDYTALYFQLKNDIIDKAFIIDSNPYGVVYTKKHRKEFNFRSTFPIIFVSIILPWKEMFFVLS